METSQHEEEGIKYHICLLCGERSEEVIKVPATGHNFVNGICQTCGEPQ